MHIDVKGLTFGYDKKRQILHEISFAVPKADFLGILGPNGTGKTTLTKCIAGILKPHAGNIFLDGRNIREFSIKDVAKRIAYVPQSSRDEFSLTVMDTVIMGRLPYVQFFYSKEDRELASMALEELNLKDMAHRPLHAMSGGEKQRVFIARALVQQPEIIILDEPTSSLDPHNQLLILKLIEKIAVEKKVTILMTIHDLNLASLFCKQLLILKDAGIFAYGKTNDVLTEANVRSVYHVNTRSSFIEGYKYMNLLR